MRIGFASIYSWRPHIEHLHFLAKLAAKAGHQTFFLTCDGDLPTCYTRELRARAAWLECLQCRVGGIRSYTTHDVDSIGRLARVSKAVPSAAAEWAMSSASTLGRFESDQDFASDEFRQLLMRLTPAVERTYAAAREWIRSNELEAVCLFNARMDATRAIAEAATDANIRWVSLERTWFSDGLQLLPDENCLGLRSLHEMMREWRDRPLTREQALKSGANIASRFLRTNAKEWRAYNPNARDVEWPGGSGAHRKVLLVPSSRNEIHGHPDWQTGWSEPTAAYDALIAHLSLKSGEVVLRCHPNWAENIGKRDGTLAERYYTEWAVRRGVHFIRSEDTASTQGLIEQCDAIVVSAGSAGLEGGILGKQVISTATTNYQEAGFQDSAYGPEAIASLRLHADLDVAMRAANSRRIARQTLRYCYTIVNRIPQFTRYVRGQTSTSYRYDIGADPQRFIDLLRTGKLQADDETFAPDASAEDEVLAIIEDRRWADVTAFASDSGAPLRRLRRRFMFRPIDWIADRKPVGDR